MVLVAAWCVFIFCMSAKSGAASQQMSDGVISHSIFAFVPGFSSLRADQQAAMVRTWSFPVRKGAHFMEYALLGILALNACVQVLRAAGKQPFDTRLVKARPRVAVLAGALVFCVLFAAGDEFHQLFVDGRSAQLFDVGVDACGACFGIVCACMLARVCRRS